MVYVDIARKLFGDHGVVVPRICADVGYMNVFREKASFKLDGVREFQESLDGAQPKADYFFWQVQDWQQEEHRW